jgi:hypothetical protein
MSNQTILIDKGETDDQPYFELGTAFNCKYKWRPDTAAQRIQTEPAAGCGFTESTHR